MEFNNCDFNNKKEELIFHFNEIYKRCRNNFTTGIGSYLFDGRKYEYDPRMFEKQKLIFDLAKQNKNIMEIGVYMGHSLLIMLLSNPSLKITCIDIDDYYSLPAVNYLKENFKEADIKFIKGDSIKKLLEIDQNFDLYHLDGNHSPFRISKEILLCLRMNKSNHIKILFDDIGYIKAVEKNIINNFDIIKKIIPDCKSKNAYYEFKFNEEKIKKFKISHNKYLFFSFPKRLIKKLIRHVKK